jgi:hypothetical protein
MYRCHFTHCGRVVAGENLLASTLDEAIEEARAVLATKAALDVDCPTGFEIWVLSDLIYTST